MGNITHRIEMKMTNTLKTRFWLKVVKAVGCWKWTGAKHPFGYGMIRAGGTKEKITASRASWLVHFGDIPAGMYVCHKCDNPECTNPEHLFLGTATDNSLDKESKERGVRKFSQSDCDMIHTLLSLGCSKRAVGRAFQTHRKSIETAFKYGAMLPNPEPKPIREPKPKSPPPIMRGEENIKAKLTAADVLEIRELHSQGLSTGEISKSFAVGKSMISHICTRRNWNHI